MEKLLKRSKSPESLKKCSTRAKKLKISVIIMVMFVTVINKFHRKKEK